MKILVVDDMPSMRKVIVYMLTSLGYEDIGEAGNGLQALTMLRLDDYGLVITDLNMPSLDGAALLKEVRGDDILQHTPVVIMSCEDSKEKIMDLINSDVTGFIVKPFNINTLKKQIQWAQPKVNVA